MKTVLLPAGLVCGLLLSVFTPAMAPAGVPKLAGPPAVQSTSVQAVYAVINRCLPRVGQTGRAVTTGLDRLNPADEREILGSRKGRVFMRPDRLLLIDFDDAPVCRVVALSVDPAVLADLVLQVFTAGDEVFRTDRFSVGDDGTFAAVYTAPGIIIRITTTRQANGNHFAALNVAKVAQPDDTPVN
ncbi:MAG: hypothetical protein AAGK00_04990 [Pseudomonadota bacterium]